MFIKGIVVYTDGGCKPNPGKVGWGAHGYHYTTETDKQGNGLGSHILTRNGYVLNNAKNKESIDAVKVLEYYDFFGSSQTEGTNNLAEIDAVKNTLTQVKDKDVHEITVYTDSDYVKRGLTEWTEVWARNDWKKKDGTDVNSRYNWESLLEVVKYIKDRGVTITINWVKGHSDNFGNIIADRLASLGVMYSISYIQRNEFKVTNAKGYWKSEVERNPLLGLKRLYFNPLTDQNSTNYYLADPGDDSDFGRRLSEAVYAIVKLNEPEPIINVVKNKQYQVTGEINSVIMLRLDRVYTPVIYDTILEHGHYSLVPNKNKGSLGLDFLDKREVTKELYPTGLPLRAVENYSYLEEILEAYFQFKEGKEITNKYFTSKNIKFTDVSSVFYENNTVSKKGKEVTSAALRKEFGVGFKTITVKVPYSDIVLDIDINLGLDTLDRNALKRVEDKNPKIYIVTWGDSEKANYCTIIDTDIGTGIWYNYFASQIFIKGYTKKE